MVWSPADTARRDRLPRQIIDLSIAIENEIISDPAPFNTKVEYFDHDDDGRPDGRLLSGVDQGRPAGRRRLGGRDHG